MAASIVDLNGRQVRSDTSECPASPGSTPAIHKYGKIEKLFGCAGNPEEAGNSIGNDNPHASQGEVVQLTFSILPAAAGNAEAKRLLRATSQLFWLTFASDSGARPQSQRYSSSEARWAIIRASCRRWRIC